MAERKGVNLRLSIVALIVANLLALAYQLFTPDSRGTAGTRIDELQINPGRIRLQGVATRGPGGQTGQAKGYRACLEWGPFSAADVSRADSALARLPLSHPAIQRPLSDAGGSKRFTYFVREPDAGIVAQIAELQRSFAGTEIKAGPCPS